MFDTLFGAEMPLAVRFFLAFLVVLGLIGATAWAVRRFGAGRLGAAPRGRQPRLAVIDYASVDGRRRLILVRRDNVEHLLMIGGPTDVVVEPNIVRAVAAPRDVATGRPAAGIEALPRAIPLPENGSNGSWPLQPEPTVSLRSSQRLEPLAEELPSRSYQPHAETPSRPPRDTLAALADELSTRAAPPRGRPAPATRPQPDELHQEPSLDYRHDVRTEAVAEAFVEPPPEPRVEPRMEPRVETRPEPRQDLRQEPRPEPRKPIVPAAPAIPAPAVSDADQSLTDMAQRLEAALRKPNAPAAEARSPMPPARPAPAPEQAAQPDAAPRPARASEPRPPRTDLKAEPRPNQSKTTLYDSLEQEMASLLGRQNKT